MSTPRVLVIDDNDDQCVYLARELRARGWEVDTAHTVRAGLELAAKNQPDVVLSELILPDTRGFQFVRSLRSMIDNGAAIIGITRLPESHFHVRALAAGFDHVHAKPVDVARLHETMSLAR